MSRPVANRPAATAASGVNAKTVLVLHLLSYLPFDCHIICRQRTSRHECRLMALSYPSSRLLTIPRELRDHIWDALIIPEVEINQDLGVPLRGTIYNAVRTACLLVNRQITEEILEFVRPIALLRQSFQPQEYNHIRELPSIPPVPAYGSTLVQHIEVYAPFQSDMKIFREEFRDQMGCIGIQTMQQIAQMAAGLQAVLIELRIRTSRFWDGLDEIWHKIIVEDLSHYTKWPALEAFSVKVCRDDLFCLRKEEDGTWRPSFHIYPEQLWMGWSKGAQAIEVVNAIDWDTPCGERDGTAYWEILSAPTANDQDSEDA